MRRTGNKEALSHFGNAGRSRGSRRPSAAAVSRCASFCALLLLLLAAPALLAADATNAAAAPLQLSPTLSNTGPSLLRVLGALAMVLGIFLGGVWFFRNGRQFAFRRGAAPRLNVLESRSLGARQAIYVVGYDQERFLVAATPNGINLLSHLPAAPDNLVAPQAHTSSGAGPMPFAQALAQVLKGNSAKDGGVK